MNIFSECKIARVTAYRTLEEGGSLISGPEYDFIARCQVLDEAGKGTLKGRMQV